MAVRCRWRSVDAMATSKEDLMFTRIVVGVDCRQGGRDALALAALLQSVGGGELVAVHACAPAPLLHEDVLTRVDTELAHVGATARPLVVTDRSPAHALRTIAERDGAELIVIGSTHRTGAERVLAGDEASATLHFAPCSVAIAPRGFASGARSLRRIGVGLDDSPESRVALALACRLAHLAGASVRATTVVAAPVPLWPAIAWDPAWTGSANAVPHRDDRLLASIVAELDDDVAHEVAVGTAWKELTSRSADVDLLVVGARAYGPVRRLLLGSTSTRLARHAACPLLVTPRGAHGTTDAPATGESSRSETHAARP
jgi:nucleotide-binding universal stress UspA family protein